MLKSKNILVVSPEPWDHIFISKHHYAIHLAQRGNKIYFLNPPGNKESIDKTQYNNVWSVTYRGFVKGLRLFPALIQKIVIAHKFRHIQELCGVEFDIIWSFDNSVFFNFQGLPDRVVKISHIVDLNQNFQFKKASQTADICFGVCSPIVEKQLNFNKKAYFIQHGYANPCLSEPLNLSFLKNDRVRVGYAGNMRIPYMDWDLLIKVITLHNEIDFIFVGNEPEESVKTRLNIFPNVYFTGRLAYEQLKGFYNQMDMLILSYRYRDFPEQLSNSHKMMEYLASGNMIVATWTSEYEKLVTQDLICMSKNHDEFLFSFQKALLNLEDYNGPAKQEKRLAFAQENTYDNQIDRIEQLLNNLNFDRAKT